jgi:diacylglycerol kinase family enzyme
MVEVVLTKPPDHPVLIVNPASGGGKAQRYDLVAQCRSRGIEAVVLVGHDDVAALAAEAVSRGADVIGMAGGDGSQGAVAAVAAEHDIPYVCVPAGTRNHFALDIGVDPRGVVNALDAFFDGPERRIDLARLNGRVFVNNASMGLYGKIVQSREYRAAKLRTAIERLPELLGPGSEPFELRFIAPDGSAHDRAHLVVVSNNRYELDPLPRRCSRAGMDQGTLGVLAVRLGPPLEAWRGDWTAPTFRIDSATRVDVGLDGEAIAIDPPLLFESLPSALRIRTPAHGGGRRSGRSAARPPGRRGSP